MHTTRRGRVVPEGAPRAPRTPFGGPTMPSARRRLPDEVRSAAIRAVLCLACTLVGLTVAVLASYADSGLLTPALMAMGLGVFGTMWCLLEILISRQIAAQRARGPHAASPMAVNRTARGAGRRDRSDRAGPTARQPRLPTT